MPPMLQRKDVIMISRALDVQRRTGRPSLTISNRCIELRPSANVVVNRNLQLVPKPMRAEEVAFVRKDTGSTCFVETKFERR